MTNKIFLVEDDKTIVSVIEQHLDTMGHGLLCSGRFSAGIC